MELSIVYQAYKYIQHGIDTATNYKRYAAEFTSMQAAYENSPQSHARNFIDQIQKIARDFLFLQTLNSEQRALLEAHNLSKVLDESFWTQPIKNIQTTKVESVKIYGAFLNEIATFVRKISSTIDILQPLAAIEDDLYNDEEALLEIVFDHRVQISTMTEAKAQFANWFLIIEGYAQLLGIPREEFLIVSMSKNSPTTIKLKAKLEIVNQVVGILSSLLLIVKEVLPQVEAINMIKQNSSLADPITQEEFVKLAEKKLVADIDNKLEKFVDEKVREHNAESSRPAVKKAFQNQINFNISGGIVNVYLNSPNDDEKVKVFEETQTEIAPKIDTFRNIKLLGQPFDNNEATSPTLEHK